MGQSKGQVVVKGPRQGQQQQQQGEEGQGVSRGKRSSHRSRKPKWQVRRRVLQQGGQARKEQRRRVRQRQRLALVLLLLLQPLVVVVLVQRGREEELGQVDGLLQPPRLRKQRPEGQEEGQEVRRQGRAQGQLLQGRRWKPLPLHPLPRLRLGRQGLDRLHLGA